MKTRVLVSYGVSIVLLCFLIEALWGAVGGSIAGLTFARDRTLQQQVETFCKQRGINASSHEEVKRALANLSPEDRAAFERMTKDALKGSALGGFGMTFGVSAAAFGIAAFVAGYFSRAWQYAWSLLAASAILNNPFRRFAMLTDMPIAQKVVIVLLAQLCVSFGAAWLGTRLALRRGLYSETPPVSENA